MRKDSGLRCRYLRNGKSPCGKYDGARARSFCPECSQAMVEQVVRGNPGCDLRELNGMTRLMNALAGRGRDV